MAKNDMSFSVDLQDNSKLILDAFQKQVKMGLEAIGATAEGHAKANCPVDTGRLRNSITWAVDGKQGGANEWRSGGAKKPQNLQDAQPSDYEKHGEPGLNTVVIGTNVEYAPPQEYFDMAHRVGQAHFLRDAATTHGNDYKKLMEGALKT